MQTDRCDAIGIRGAVMTPEERIDKNLSRVLNAAGTSLGYFAQKNIDDLRQAMRDIMSEAYIDGSNDCHKIMTEE